VSDTCNSSFNYQVTVQKVTAKEPSMRCRNIRDDVKTCYSSLAGIGLRATCLLLRRHPAYRWHDLYRGFYVEIGTCRLNGKGNIQSSDPVRIKVPKSGTGAD